MLEGNKVEDNVVLFFLLAIVRLFQYVITSDASLQSSYLVKMKYKSNLQNSTECPNKLMNLISNVQREVYTVFPRSSDPPNANLPIEVHNPNL